MHQDGVSGAYHLTKLSVYWLGTILTFFPPGCRPVPEPKRTHVDRCSSS
jgi:hypothetical protein